MKQLIVSNGKWIGSLLLGCLLASGIAHAAATAAPTSVAIAIPADRVIQVEAGTHKLVRENATIRRVAVGEPTIADVNVINGRELLVSGKKIGITSLIVWTGAAPTEYRIRVGAVKDPMQPSASDPELADARVEKGYSLEGSMPNLIAHRRASLGAANGKDPITDTSSVDLDTQVMTQIKIAEINRSTAQRYGVNFFKNIANTTAGISGPGGLSGIEVNPTTDRNQIVLQSGSGFVPLQDAFSLVFGSATNGLLGVLSVLEGKGMARVLAEPSLTAMSGQTASFLAGGEFPIPVAQGGGSGNASITITYKEFGIRVNLTPTVLSRDRISLKVAPEVSDLDYTAAVSINGISVPALKVRRTDTTVELGDGESFVISGLVSTSLVQNVDKVPWLGDVPVLGAFFKSASVDRSSRELIMIVTPHLVRPLAREARLPPLPGAAYDKTQPSYGRLVLEETGDFKPSDYGFGR
ncbi:MAG: type and secretion system protein family protein [Hydrocarboniphaga sp.]|uniref:type II and III secretion system protein family protein n=1 Tax=Hydrocarboniphaga sp. TaxID=2033016 RepID=UPI0026180648|nr:type II and III secretion system protein family protein [Hydrocarboniphaga sp.]MDB5972400.1 type and secretion system protein family protein [Hydrocarboniphaga sp.]